MVNYIILDIDIYFTLFFMIRLSIFIAFILLFLSFYIAIQIPDSEKISSYECGFEPFEDARNRFDVRFYIVSILFLIFDLELVYLFPWASTLSLIGYFGFIVASVFLILLRIDRIIGFVNIGPINVAFAKIPLILSVEFYKFNIN